MWFLCLQEEDYPNIVMGIFVEKPMPFLREFFEHIANLDYPKSRIDVFLHNSVSTARSQNDLVNL